MFFKSLLTVRLIVPSRESFLGHEHVLPAQTQHESGFRATEPLLLECTVVMYVVVPGNTFGGPCC